MDIEGAEYEVLSKPGHEALKNCRYLQIELHNRGGYPKTEAVSAIKRLGFREFDQKIAPYPDVYCFENKDLKEKLLQESLTCTVLDDARARRK